LAKLCAVAAIAWCSASVHAAALQSDLADRLQRAAPDELVPVIVELQAQVAPEAAVAGASDRRSRAAALIRALRAKAAATQGEVVAYLTAAEARSAAARVRAYWLVNAVSAHATADTIRALLDSPAVAGVQLDAIQTLPPVTIGEDQPAIAVSEWGIDKIRAPLVWQYLSQRGAGALVGVIDTGFDSTHPDLQNWAGAWYDAVNGLPNPYDDNTGVWHGTHVTGTAVGGNAGGTDIGVAPQAQFISCKAFNSGGSAFNSDILDCMQWMTDPDGNPDTDDYPDVVNNSWGGASFCLSTFQNAVRAWWTLGIFPNFAAGNNGPGVGSGSIPATYPESFGVGATDINDNIASFSGRGPSACDGSIFPEVSAPGVAIRSARGGGGYHSLNGTSMATPHVTGCIALMRAQNPNISVAWTWWLLRRFAVDLGAPGADNAFGAGRIDCALPSAYAKYVP
jgi:subtilisin family serine protease